MIHTQNNSISQKTAMIRGGKIIKSVMNQLEKQIAPGITTLELNNIATKLIHNHGTDTSFDKVPGYYFATCMSVNEIVVHGVPNKTKLKKADVLKIDIGVYEGGYHVDYGNTFLVGMEEKGSIKAFLDKGRRTLLKAIQKTAAGVHIGVISKIIQNEIEGSGYKVIWDLTGHGVGKELHEDPLIPGFLSGKIENTPKFKSGRAYAIEIIYSMADNQVILDSSDGWSLRTVKRSQSACFEHSVFVDNNEVTVLVN
jgi:methionyl aminopeptidase